MSLENFDLRLVAGFIVIVSGAILLDKAGDALFHRGIAKPFYLLGHRLHHGSFLLTIVPASYVVVGTLISVRYLHIVWPSFWTSAEITLFLVGTCLAFDLALDAVSNKEKRAALLHHEWAYLLVPAYVFTHLLVFA